MGKILIALLLVSNASGKTLVRQQQGSIVPAAAATKPLISSMNCDLTHLRWNGTRVVDLRSIGWSMAGTVPQVAKAPPLPASAGNFSDANHYLLEAGRSTVSGDFSVCAIGTWTTGTTALVMFSNTNGSNVGWTLQKNNAAQTCGVYAYTPGIKAATTATTVAAGGFFVCCGGIGGGNVLAKMNGGAIASVSSSGVVAASAASSYVGRYNSVGASWAGTLYEVCVSSTAASDTLFSNVMAEVKSKTGTTAW